MKAVVVLSGPVSVGKSHFAEALARAIKVHRVSTRAYILKHKGVPNDRGPLQAAGTQLDEETGGLWVVAAVKESIADCPADAFLLLDSARIGKQVQALREEFGEKTLHVHLAAEDDTLRTRYQSREHDVVEFQTYEEVRASPTEAAIGTLAGLADLVLQTDASTPTELVNAALVFFGISPATQYECLVDVFVGGQYGSEGKGNICSFLANQYDVLMRIGGPNAGHRAAHPPYKYVQLPSGTGANPKAKIIIGAGSTLWLPQLMMEISDHALNAERLSIDPYAMIIDDEDRRIESGSLSSIASTKQGVGSASARKILGRGDRPIFGPPVQLAKDVGQLRSFVRDTKAELEQAFASGHKVMLEGTQGTSLSIHHGRYPFVTSRETTASGCLSDAGISPKHVRKVVMVTRTYPIRVGGTSGPIGRELTFDVMAERSGIALSELLRVEKGTISGTLRRVAEFDWMQLRRSTLLNGPTDIALTFVDYLGVRNRTAKNFEQLLADTKTFIQKVERVSGVPVTIISKEFAKDGVIVREGWQ